MFARVSPDSMKALGEDPEEFEKLRQSLRDAVRPREGFEAMLVEDMAVNRFRLARLHKAEAGIVALQRLKIKVNYGLMPVVAESAASNDNLLIEPFGLASASESAEKYHHILDLLRSVQAAVEKEGFSTQGLKPLQMVYGKSPGVTGSGLLLQYKAELESQKPEAHPREDEEKNAACARFLEALGRDIHGFTLRLTAMLLAPTQPIPEPFLDSRLLPALEELDKIMRYEAHLERQFQWLLQRLMSWRKVYVDVAGAETWEP